MAIQLKHAVFPVLNELDDGTGLKFEPDEDIETVISDEDFERFTMGRFELALTGAEATFTIPFADIS